MLQPLIRIAGASLGLLLVAPLGASAASLAVPPADAQYDSGSLHIARYGHGDPVVLIPGLACGPWEWSDTIRHLLARYTVYAVTLPGFDGRPATTPPLFSRSTADLWTFLDAQKIARPVVIGHSLGGTLAILLGEQRPERLRGIIALEGLPILPGMERINTEQRLGAADQTYTQIAGQSHQQLLDYEKGYMKTAGGVLDAPLGEQVAELEARSDPAAVAQWLREDLGSDLRPDLPRVSAPLLEIAPYNAPDVVNAPVSYTEDQKATYYRGLLAGAPKVQIVTISPARHFVLLDQPDRVFAVIDAFLAQNR